MWKLISKTGSWLRLQSSNLIPCHCSASWSLIVVRKAFSAYACHLLQYLAFIVTWDMLYTCLVFYCFSSMRTRRSWVLLRSCCHQPWRLDSVAHLAIAIIPGTVLAAGPASTAFCCPESTTRMSLPLLLCHLLAPLWKASVLYMHVLAVKKARKQIAKSFSFHREKQPLPVSKGSHNKE